MFGFLGRSILRLLGLVLLCLVFFQAYRGWSEFRAMPAREYASRYIFSFSHADEFGLSPAYSYDALPVLAQIAHRQVERFNRAEGKNFFPLGLTPPKLPAKMAKIDRQSGQPNFALGTRTYFSGPCLFRAIVSGQEKRKIVRIEAICDADGDGFGEFKQILLIADNGIFSEKRFASHERASFMEYLNFGLDAPPKLLAGRLGFLTPFKFLLGKLPAVEHSGPAYLVRKGALVSSRNPEAAAVADDFGAGKKGKWRRALAACGLNRALLFDLILTLILFVIGWKLMFRRRRRDRWYEDTYA